MASEGAERRLAAILSADVVGDSRLMAKDEASTIRSLSACREQVTTLVQEHRGCVSVYRAFKDRLIWEMLVNGCGPFSMPDPA